MLLPCFNQDFLSVYESRSSGSDSHLEPHSRTPGIQSISGRPTAELGKKSDHHRLRQTALHTSHERPTLRPRLLYNTSVALLCFYPTSPFVSEKRGTFNVTSQSQGYRHVTKNLSVCSGRVCVLCLIGPQWKIVLIAEPTRQATCDSELSWCG